MSSRLSPKVAGALLGAVFLALQAAPGVAQEEEEAERNYKVEAEAGASLFFGATSQTTVIFKSSAEYRGWERFLLGGRAAYEGA